MEMWHLFFSHWHLYCNTRFLFFLVCLLVEEGLFGRSWEGMEGLTGDPFMRNTSDYVPWLHGVISCFSLVRGLRAFFCIIYLFSVFVL